jgi:excisionase family DNA binding protein
MNAVARSGALASREEVPAPLSTSVNEGNNNILTGLPYVLTLEQAAETLQIPLQTARAMCRERSLPSFKVGQRWRIPRAWLEEYMRGGGSHE